MQPCLVKCPNRKCGFIFDSSETFYWGRDKHGDPTIENIYCPKCWVSTNPIDKRRTQYRFEDFVEVIDKNE